MEQVMGQVLLPHVGGEPFCYPISKGGLGCIGGVCAYVYIIEVDAMMARCCYWVQHLLLQIMRSGIGWLSIPITTLIE